jgi:heat shock protein HslJ
MFRKRCSGYHACFHLKPVFYPATSETVIALPVRVQGMTDDPEGALLDPDTTEQDKTTTTQPQKMGLAFYGALALVGVLVFLIVFVNVPGIRASAGMLLIQNTWTLQSYVDTSGVLSPAITGTPITARFSTDGKVRGSGGCNQYSANYTTRDLAISISPPVMTEMYCEKSIVMQQETDYINDLSKAVEIRVSESNLNLYDMTGKPVLMFVTT